MEEIYKPNTDGPEKVEVYSRENNDMLGDMPEWLIHTGSYIVYGLIVFLIAGTALFKYPDTIRKTITIDDLGSAEWITANQAGLPVSTEANDMTSSFVNATILLSALLTLSLISNEAKGFVLIRPFLTALFNMVLSVVCIWCMVDCANF